MDVHETLFAPRTGQTSGKDPIPGPESSNAHVPEGQDYAELRGALRLVQDNLLRYQELFDFAPVGYVVTDLRGVIIEANYAAAAMFGARKQFLVGTPLLFLVAKSDRHAFGATLARLVVGVCPQLQWVLRLDRARDGPLDVIASVDTATTAGDSNVLRWTFRDITRQRKTEEHLQAQRQFTESLIELADAVIVVLDQAGRIVRANGYLYALTEHEPGDLAGSLLVDLVLPDDQVALERELCSLVMGNRNAHGTMRLLGEDRQTRTIAWSARILMVPPGKNPRTLLIGNDITDLQEAQRRAVQAERLAAIGEMSAGLAHESRNALQRGMASLGLLAFRLHDQPELMTLVERVQKAQDDLHRLYESVREFAAPIKLQVEYCDLATLWREAWEELTLARKGRDAELYEQIEVANPRCSVSPTHVKQVFRNLLENALSATEAPLRIGIRCTEADIDGRDAVQIAVEDNGPGFCAEDRDRAFKVFFTTKVRGSGLGLSICKRLVEAHGGGIAVAQPNGRGAVIVLTLPRRREYETTDSTAADRGR